VQLQKVSSTPGPFVTQKCTAFLPLFQKGEVGRTREKVRRWTLTFEIGAFYVMNVMKIGSNNQFVIQSGFDSSTRTV
jgi:hypothetical protein